MEWYIFKTAEHAWSMDVLEHQIDTNLYQRQILAEKTTNYPARLDVPQSNLWNPNWERMT